MSTNSNSTGPLPLLKTASIADILRSLPTIEQRLDKEVWRLDRDTLELVLDRAPGYEIDLERCRTAAQVLDWIAAVSGKTWATNDVVGSLVRSLNAVFGLHRFCGMALLGETDFPPVEIVKVLETRKRAVN